MTTNYIPLEAELNTPYRQHVRQVIPEDIQDAIRSACGDERIPGTSGFLRLPPICSLDLPNDRFRAGASALRDHPELVGEMRWHFAAIASYVGNIENLERIVRSVHKRVESI